MMAVIELMLSFLCIVFIAIPSCFLAFELINGAFQRGLKKNAITPSNATYKVLIPAHNEESILARTLDNVSLHVPNMLDVIVVADNCSDNTAQIANQYGCTVIERQNQLERGKGYALDAGIQLMRSLESQPQVVVVFDADCEFTENSLDSMVGLCVARKSVVQSFYRMVSTPDQSTKTRIAEFAWLIKNLVRPLTLSRIDSNCQLQGSGMTFPWRVFDSVSFASGSIVEDLELGLKLSKLGEKIVFAPEIEVVSYFPENDNASKTQRTRWEHGHLSSIKTLFQPLVSSVKHFDFKLTFSLLDAIIPPTVFWLILVSGSVVLSLLLALVGVTLPAFIVVISWFSMLAGLFLVWFKRGRRLLSLKDIVPVLKYILGKFTIYRSFISNRQKSWIRTERD